MGKTETYEEFVEKFKPKLTTDDCYTPKNVYQAVKNWAIEEYKWGGRTVVRPFCPGGDYENYEYPENCVVIDNPPFSCIAKIANFYKENRIDYLLFAPHLTCLGIRGAKSHICVGVPVTYENGARVDTSFICSEGPLIRSSPKLYEIVNEANKENTKTKKAQLKYSYPDNVLTSNSVAMFSQYGIEYQEDKAIFTRRLDHQREKGKEIYGSGYIVPIENARRAQEERRRAQEERRIELEETAIKWQLSKRELEELKNIE